MLKRSDNFGPIEATHCSTSIRGHLTDYQINTMISFIHETAFAYLPPNIENRNVIGVD